MDVNKERKILLEEISQTNLIPSLKAQLKMEICDQLNSNGKIETKRPITEESEIANNIIFEFLLSNGFQSSASIFYAESKLHQMSRKEMIKSLQIDDQPGLISELLLDYKSRSNASIQKESDDISSKLEAVELQIRKKRQFTRMQSSEDQLRRGLETIDRDYEIKFQKELNSRLEIFRSTELSQVKSDTLRRHETELEKIRVELESDLKKKTADLYVQFEKDSEVLRMKQREIEREICKWSDRKIEEIANEADCAEAAAIRADTEKKLKMIKERTMQIQRKVEERMRELEDIRLANNKAKRESEKLKLAIEIYRKSNES